MSTDSTELTFVRCPSCRSLVPAVSTRCRMCGASLDADDDGETLEEPAASGRVRQHTTSTADDEVFAETADSARKTSPTQATVAGGDILSPEALEAADDPGDPGVEDPLSAYIEEVEMLNDGDDSSADDIFDEIDDLDDFEDELDPVEELVEPAAPPEPEPLSPEPPASDPVANDAPAGFAPLDEIPELQPIEDVAPEPVVEDPVEPVAVEADPFVPEPEPVAPTEPVYDMGAPVEDEPFQPEEPVYEATEQFDPEPVVEETPQEVQAAVEPPQEPVVSVEADLIPEPVAPVEVEQPLPEMEEVYEEPEPVPAEPAVEVAAVGGAPTAPARVVQNVSGRLFGWLVNYSTPEGIATELREGQFFISGQRLKATDLLIENPSVSTPHAMVTVDVNGGFRVQDLMSERGVFLRKTDQGAYQRVSGVIVVENGDWIRIGDVEFLVSLIPYVGVS